MQHVLPPTQLSTVARRFFFAFHELNRPPRHFHTIVRQRRCPVRLRIWRYGPWTSGQRNSTGIRQYGGTAGRRSTVVWDGDDGKEPGNSAIERDGKPLEAQELKEMSEAVQDDLDTLNMNFPGADKPAIIDANATSAQPNIHEQLKRIASRMDELNRRLDELSRQRDDSVRKAPPSQLSVSEMTTHVMRKLSSSPVVITTLSADRENDGLLPRQQDLRAMTVSSFTTVTMKPNPVISFNVRRPSRTLDGILRWRVFPVHILDSSPEGASIAHAFTRGDPVEAFEKILKIPGLKTRRNQNSNRIHHPSVFARLNCTLIPEKTVTIGDHSVIFATVENVAMGRASSNLSSVNGLVYQDGAYRSPGSAVLEPSGTNKGSGSRPTPNPSDTPVEGARPKRNTPRARPISTSSPKVEEDKSGKSGQDGERNAALDETKDEDAWTESSTSATLYTENDLPWYNEKSEVPPSDPDANKTEEPHLRIMYTMAGENPNLSTIARRVRAKYGMSQIVGQSHENGIPSVASDDSSTASTGTSKCFSVQGEETAAKNEPSEGRKGERNLDRATEQ
ncbi:hypothetical protein NA57DRAFT_78427 [Rhizodiscina lignyota]|uniref:Flavin reductase like domain-containing protein n=1 Tax=Rhizodiscina lignyota TaxID=1504668 RepID=A0A9P4M701_9PEZI|nr:hypothetical protein NA57DRAFT_78427 [Rhizodiscina lignyota]